MQKKTSSQICGRIRSQPFIRFHSLSVENKQEKMLFPPEETGREFHSPTVKRQKNCPVVLIILFSSKLYYLLGWLGDKVKAPEVYFYALLCCHELKGSCKELENNSTHIFPSIVMDISDWTFNRRHNKDTHHTAIIQLATAGTIAGFDIDTSFFDGSHPSYASVEGCLIVKGVKDSYEVRISEDATEQTFVFLMIIRDPSPHQFFFNNG